MHLRQIFPFGFFVISVFFSNGQAEKVSLDALAGKFVKEIRANERERILLLTDKKFYAAGENLWLKAWCLGTVTNKVISRSKNLYVDLVDDHDSAISQLLFNNADNKTAGRILIPESLKEGYYWLRAYTINILKEDSTGIFVKPIYVLNSAKSDPRSVNSRLFGNSYAASDSIARVNFYPEVAPSYQVPQRELLFLPTTAPVCPKMYQDSYSTQGTIRSQNFAVLIQAAENLHSTHSALESILPMY